MVYNQYICKKRMKKLGICGNVNIPYGTILEATGDFILYHGRQLCAVRSQNSKDYFWGYSKENPEAEIKRQKTVLELLKSAPDATGDELSTPNNEWSVYGKLAETTFGTIWEWDKSVEDLPYVVLKHLLTKTKTE